MLKATLSPNTVENGIESEKPANHSPLYSSYEQESIVKMYLNWPAELT